MDAGQSTSPTSGPDGAPMEGVLRSLIDVASEGMCAVDAGGRCVVANRACVELLGYTSEQELRGQRIHAVVHHTQPDGTPCREAECEIVRAIRDGRQLQRDDEVFVRRDGTRFPVQHRSFPLHRDGRLVGALLTFTDISDRQRVLRELEKNRLLQHIAGTLAKVGGWSIDLETQHLQWSEEADAIYGWDGPGDAPGLTASLDLCVPEHRATMNAAMAALATRGEPMDIDLESFTFRGDRIWVRALGEAIRAEDGTITQLVGAVQDITAQREAAQQNEQLTEQLRSMLESITDGFATIDFDWRFTYLNPKAKAMLRDPDGRIVGQRLWDVFHRLDGSPEGAVYRRAMEERVTSSFEDAYLPLADAWFDVTIYPSEDGVSLIARDTTERHRATEELQRRERELRRQAQLLDKARDAIVVRDFDHRATYWNQAAADLYGWTAEEMSGRSVREVLYPDQDRFDEAMQLLWQLGEWSGEIDQVTRDGTRRIIEARWTLIRDESDQPESVLSISRDITDRKRVEQQQYRAQRLESLGTLAAGIAHDLNNVLSPILLSAQLLQFTQADPAELAKSLQIIEKSTLRGADLVRQVLSFAKGMDGPRRALDITAIVDEVAGIAAETFPRNIRIRKEVLDAPWPVTGDATQLHQVLTNLCVNARDAMPEGGTLWLLVRNVTLDDSDAARLAGARPGSYVVVGVEDDGSGMPPDVIDRLFEPFYTTKPHGQGSGLGLPTSHGIVSSHGGFIQVYSELGTGSTFNVFLPTSSSSDLDDDQLLQDLGSLPRGSGQTVLVVDDEPASREAISRVLTDFGYRVLCAADGGEAISLAQDDGETVDVLLTDMMMPNVDGVTAIRTIRRARPDLPVIAISGLSATRESEAQEMGIHLFLSKPFSAAGLLRAVHSALHS